SRPHEGLGARLECSRWKYRSERRAVADAASDGIWFCKSLPGNPDGGRSLPSERRADVAAAADHRGDRRVFLHEQPHLGTLHVQIPTLQRQAQATVGYVLHLHRNVRLFYRLLRGVSAVDQDPIPGGHGWYCLPRTAGGFPLASAWRIARGQNRRRDRDVLEL